MKNKMNKTLKLFLLISFFYSAAPAPDAENSLISHTIFNYLKFDPKVLVTEEYLKNTQMALQFACKLPEIERKVRGRVFINVGRDLFYPVTSSNLKGKTVLQLNQMIKAVQADYKKSTLTSKTERLDTTLFYRQIDQYNFLNFPELYLEDPNFLNVIIDIAKQLDIKTSRLPDSEIFRNFLTFAIKEINQKDDKEKNLIITDQNFRIKYIKNIWGLFASSRQDIKQKLADELKNFKNSIIITTTNFCRNPENFIESDFFSEIVISMALNVTEQEMRQRTPDSQVFEEFAQYAIITIAEMQEKGQEMDIYIKQFKDDGSSEFTYHPDLSEFKQTLWMSFVSSNRNIKQRLADELKVLESKGLKD